MINIKKELAMNGTDEDLINLREAINFELKRRLDSSRVPTESTSIGGAFGGCNYLDYNDKLLGPRFEGIAEKGNCFVVFSSYDEHSVFKLGWPLAFGWIAIFDKAHSFYYKMDMGSFEVRVLRKDITFAEENKLRNHPSFMRADKTLDERAEFFEFRMNDNAFLELTVLYVLDSDYSFRGFKPMPGYFSHFVKMIRDSKEEKVVKKYLIESLLMRDYEK